MLTRPLTREEALTRARLIGVDSYDISLDLIGCDEGASTFGSETRIAFSCTQPGTSTFAEFRSTEHVTALLNGREVEVADGRIMLDELSAMNGVHDFFFVSIGFPIPCRAEMLAISTISFCILNSETTKDWRRRDVTSAP